MTSVEQEKANGSNVDTKINDKKVDSKEQPPEDDDDARTVFVGNLQEKVTNEILYELFMQVSS